MYMIYLYNYLVLDIANEAYIIYIRTHPIRFIPFVNPVSVGKTFVLLCPINLSHFCHFVPRIRDGAVVYILTLGYRY